MTNNRSLPEKAHPFCLQCHREVPPKRAIAVVVSKNGTVVGYLHQFKCREQWDATHPRYEYGVVPQSQE